MEFHLSSLGKKFYQKDLPDLIKSLNRLADAIEKKNRLEESKNRKNT